MCLAVIKADHNPRVAAACILAELLGIPWIELTTDGPPEGLTDIPILIWVEKGEPPAAWLDRPRLILAIPPMIRQINFMLKIKPPAPLPNGGIILRFESDPIGEFLTCFRTSLVKGPPQHFLYEEIVDNIKKAIHDAISTVSNLPYPIYKKPWSLAKPALCCITGDVDALKARSFFENISRWVKSTIRKDVYRRRQAWRAMWRRRNPSPAQIIEHFHKPLAEHGGRGTLFWAMESSHHLDPQYNTNDPGVKELIKYWCTVGEAGLHGSYHSATHPEALMIQFQRLADICTPPHGVRQHYLRLESTNTWLSQASLGLKYDSTLCPHKGIGITCGISTPFPLFDPIDGAPLGIWQLPVMMMDGALFQYEHYDMVASFPLIEHHIHRIVEAGGCVTVLYHPQTMDERVYPSVYKSYQMFIEKITNLRIDMVTAEDAISWRKALWEIKPVACQRKGDKTTLRLVSNAEINSLTIIDHKKKEIWQGNLGESQDLSFPLSIPK